MIPFLNLCLFCSPWLSLTSFLCFYVGISRDGMHKRSHTSAKRAQIRKKRKFELGRQPSNTKIGEKRIHLVRARGGNMKYRALRLNSGKHHKTANIKNFF